MKKIMLVIAMMSLPVFGQDNPLWMFASQSKFHDYVVSQIQMGSVNLYSGGQVNQYNLQSDVWEYRPPNNNGNDLEVINLLKGARLTFAVTRPETDWVNVSVFLYNERGQMLFHGGDSAKFSTEDGVNFEFPVELLNVGLQMNSWKVPVYVERAVQARIIAHDGYGNTIPYDLAVEDGWIDFPPRFLSSDTDIAITMWDDAGLLTRTLVTSLRNEDVRSPATFEASGPDIMIDGVVNYERLLDYGNYVSYVLMADSSGHGESPVIRLRSKQENCPVYLNIHTSDGQRPSGFWIRNPGTNERTYVSYSPSGGMGMWVTLPTAGFYSIVAEWEEFDKTTFEWWWMDYLYDGGGKGKPARR